MLRGRVSPVGKVKEKVLGAHRAGAIVPWVNRKDVELEVLYRRMCARVCSSCLRGRCARRSTRLSKGCYRHDARSCRLSRAGYESCHSASISLLVRNRRILRFAVFVWRSHLTQFFLFECSTCTSSPLNDTCVCNPIFQPESFNQTYAEMAAFEKNAISHRSKALRKLREHLSSWS